VNTKGYQGKTEKAASVYTNDPRTPKMVIGLIVDVQVPIIVTPRYVLFTGIEGRKNTQFIDIIAALDKPLKLKPAQFSLEDRMDYRIVDLEKGRKFRIHFSNTPQASGTFRGFLNIETNYSEKPMLNINIHARIQKAG
jgi:hypothetical protein